MQENQQTVNRLIDETSPYLQQHAHNPVDWFPWGEEALLKARQENKPILLSIGYSACHWCHVMAHESFEDAATARVMNELFVNIKVDREERPDLDKIYQFAHQVLTQRGGGWPLTMMLMPNDQAPFFGGTYFPNEPRHGMPSFIEIMQRVAAFYHEHPDEIAQQNESLVAVLKQVTETTAADTSAINAVPLDQARHQLAQSYDGLYGGFGESPKFPHPTNIERLLRHWHATTTSGTADIRALDMVKTTLKAMALGGLYDQLGGGFCRYSVDQEWMIPHFEKMLYDNGPLLTLYAQAWQATGDKLFYRIAAETAEWAMREMQSLEGGYYSTLDADSEGQEGKFYAWDNQTIKSLLSEEQYDVFARLFGFIKLDGQPGQANFEGQWHLHTMQTFDRVTKQLDLDEETVLELLTEARQILFRAREERVHPGRDEKILTAWNGLMIKGMAVAGRILDRKDFIVSAERALDFIRESLWRDGRLLVTYKDNKAHLMAYLDDYVFLIDGILELLQTRWREGELEFACALADVVLEHFEDKDNGGFFFTADDHEQLLQRSKPFMDEAIPAGNGIAAYTLQRLGHVLGETRYLHAAENCLKAAWQSIQRTPHAHNAMLAALEEYLYPPDTIIICGTEQEAKKWGMQASEKYAPNRIITVIGAVDGNSHAINLGMLNQYEKHGDITAYICTGQQCSAPITEFDEFVEKIDR